MKIAPPSRKRRRVVVDGTPERSTSPVVMAQAQQIPTDVLILQVLQQLQQQQLVTNELLQNHRETQEQQRIFIQQQGEALRNLQVQVPVGPEAILDSLAGNIKEFRYDVES